MKTAFTLFVLALLSAGTCAHASVQAHFALLESQFDAILKDLDKDAEGKRALTLLKPLADPAGSHLDAKSYKRGKKLEEMLPLIEKLLTEKGSANAPLAGIESRRKTYFKSLSTKLKALADSPGTTDPSEYITRVTGIVSNVLSPLNRNRLTGKGMWNSVVVTRFLVSLSLPATPTMNDLTQATREVAKILIDRVEAAPVPFTQTPRPSTSVGSGGGRSVSVGDFNDYYRLERALSRYKSASRANYEAYRHNRKMLRRIGRN